MKIVVVSDSHRRYQLLEVIKDENLDADLFIHCGDFESSGGLPEGFIVVSGNNDYSRDIPEERVLNIDGIKILVTHSHQYYYNRRLAGLWEKARKLHCQIVCFGHTHTPYIDKREGIWLVNPGSLLYNRDGSKLQYVVIIIKTGVIESIKEVPLPVI